MASTKDVLDHHLKCFGEGDLAGVLSDYASDVVVFMPGGPLTGKFCGPPRLQTTLMRLPRTRLS